MPEMSMAVKVQKASVIKDLKLERFDDLPFDIDVILDELLEEAGKLIEARVFYDKRCFVIDKANKNLILNKKNIIHEGIIYKNLSHCDYLLFIIATIGVGLENRVKEYFALGEYLKGMILDVIGNNALAELNRMFCSSIKEDLQRENYGMTCRYSPGEKNWDLKGQSVIFDILSPSKEVVDLSEHYMMRPLKSISGVYGIKKGIKSLQSENECSQCELKDCIYRKESAKRYKVAVKSDNEEKILLAKEGDNILNLLNNNQLYIDSPCGGNQTCGKCKVLIKAKKNVPIAAKEYELLTQEELTKGIRLACFHEVKEDGLTIIIPSAGKANIALDAKESVLDIKQRIKKVSVNLIQASLDDQRDYVKRLIESLSTKISYTTQKSLFELAWVYKKNIQQIECVIRKEELLSIKTPDDNTGIYGIAIDIGTTTIAAYLEDLSTGQKIDNIGRLNPQKAYGADVITRIGYTKANEEGLQILHTLIKNEINNVIEALCLKNGITQEEIYEVSIVGNTTMLHLFCNIPCENIANSPYIPTFTSSLMIKGKDMKIKINPEGYILIAPSVAAYVGADTIGAVLSSGMSQNKEICLLLDIGTNGEIVIGNKEKLLCCSAAAGPAFEGANITCGVGAVDGAINHVDFSKEPMYTTINNYPPIGICGSGLIDAVAELKKYKIVNESGRMKKREELSPTIPVNILSRIREIDGKISFLFDEEKTILLTQGDIRKLQLAKGAVLTGINILIKEMNISSDQVTHVYLAGGFGSFINIDSALEIKLIPKDLKGKISSIGNAAGAGARQLLIDDNSLELANKIKSKMEYLELSNYPGFQMYYTEALHF